MSNELTTLATLAVEINALESQANQYAHHAVVYAAMCGEKLIQAKVACKHGEFGQWIAKNCRVKQATANKYMKLARETDYANCSLMSNLDFAAMYTLLSAQDEVKEEVASKIEAGESVTVKEIQALKAQAKAAQDEAYGAKAMLRIINEKHDQVIKDKQTLARDYESTVDELNIKIEKLENEVKTKADSIAGKYKFQLETTEFLAEQSRKALQGIIDQYKANISELEEELKTANSNEAKEAIRVRIENEIAAGKNAHIAELTRREEQSLQRIDILNAQSKALDAKNGLRIRAREALKAIDIAMTTISVELTDIADEIAETGEELPAEDLADWNRFAKDYQVGISVINNILNGMKSPKLKVIK